MQQLSLDLTATAPAKRTLRMPLFLVKLVRYEFWPFWILFFPALFYGLWLALRSRSLTYFSAANPGIELGGVFGESKINILKKITPEFLPVTLFFEAGVSAAEICAEMENRQLSFPIICKPDKGERGFRVERIANVQELQAYLENAGGRLIVQEFITYSIELGILYYRFPDGGSGISSIVRKEFLGVTGDGISTLAQLLNNSVRARLRMQELKHKLGHQLQTIPAPGEYVLIEPIGNHCLGTKFLDGCGLADAQLVQTFDRIAGQMDGFYFGRFDLKTASIDDLRNGRNIRIMEVNGVTSEPAHIYDPEMNLLKAYRAIFQNMRIIHRIAQQNHKKGVPYVSVREVISTVRQHFRQKKQQKTRE